MFKEYRFEDAFQVRKTGNGRVCSSIICPAAAVAGSVAASQAINLAIGKKTIDAPRALFFDLFREEPFWFGELG